METVTIKNDTCNVPVQEKEHTDLVIAVTPSGTTMIFDTYEWYCGVDVGDIIPYGTVQLIVTDVFRLNRTGEAYAIVNKISDIHRMKTFYKKYDI